MITAPRPLERAFELAKSGKVLSIPDIKLALRSEGYSAAQLEGPMLIRQLRALISAAHHRIDRPRPARGPFQRFSTGSAEIRSST